MLRFTWPVLVGAGDGSLPLSSGSLSTGRPLSPTHSLCWSLGSLEPGGHTETPSEGFSPLGPLESSHP